MFLGCFRVIVLVFYFKCEDTIYWPVAPFGAQKFATGYVDKSSSVVVYTKDANICVGIIFKRHTQESNISPLAIGIFSKTAAIQGGPKKVSHH